MENRFAGISGQMSENPRNTKMENWLLSSTITALGNPTAVHMLDLIQPAAHRLSYSASAHD